MTRPAKGRRRNGAHGRPMALSRSARAVPSEGPYQVSSRPETSSTRRVGNSSGPSSAKGVEVVLSAARRRAGLDHATCHELRHTCLTRLQEAGMALEAVQAQAIVKPGQKHRLSEPGAGDLVAVDVRNAFYEAVRAQPPQVITHLPAGDGLGGLAEELRDERAQVAVGETMGQELKGAQGGEQGVRAQVTEPQGAASPMVSRLPWLRCLRAASCPGTHPPHIVVAQVAPPPAYASAGRTALQADTEPEDMSAAAHGSPMTCGRADSAIRRIDPLLSRHAL